MASGRTVRRGGPYNRLAEPSWADPLDTSYSRRGGRWNPSGSFGALYLYLYLYLNRNLRVARLQVQHKLRGHPYGVEDLDESEQHDLVRVEFTERDWLDCLTVPGLEMVGLPANYPRHRNGRPVRHVDCQPIGRAAFEDGRPGIACRSAATGTSPTDEDLAVFDRGADTGVRMTGRQPFAAWFWGGVTTVRDRPRTLWRQMSVTVEVRIARGVGNERMEALMAGVEARSFDAPDETRTPDKTTVEIVRMGGTSASRMSLQPGWRWSESIKPIVGGERCQMRHVGVLQSGTMHVVHDDGTEQAIGGGDAYVIEPGHDAWVVGDEPVIGFEFESQTAEDYAKGS